MISIRDRVAAVFVWVWRRIRPGVVRVWGRARPVFVWVWGFVPPFLYRATLRDRAKRRMMWGLIFVGWAVWAGPDMGPWFVAAMAYGAGLFISGHETWYLLMEGAVRDTSDGD